MRKLKKFFVIFFVQATYNILYQVLPRLTEIGTKKTKNLTNFEKKSIIKMSLKGGYMIFMNKKDSASISIMKIIGVSLIIILILGVSVMATEIGVRTVEITMSNGYTMTVVTTKTNIAEILEDNNIIIEEDEKVSPDLSEEIKENNKIVIANKSEQEVQIAKISESGIQTTLDEILKSYSPIIEKIVVEQENIPYETITKDASQGATDTKNKIIQQGEDGIKEITYKIKYQNDEEIERIKLSETVIKEPVNKIVQVQREVTSRGTTPTTTSSTGTTKIFKVTAYCSCAKCCGKTTGITASGTKATAGRTVATSAQFAFGTKLNIAGNTYTVEDRGGAIQGNRIDIYMNSHAEAVAWGVRYLPVEVVE